MKLQFVVCHYHDLIHECRVITAYLSPSVSVWAWVQVVSVQYLVAGTRESTWRETHLNSTHSTLRIRKALHHTSVWHCCSLKLLLYTPSAWDTSCIFNVEGRRRWYEVHVLLTYKNERKCASWLTTVIRWMCAHSPADNQRSGICSCCFLKCEILQMCA